MKNSTQLSDLDKMPPVTHAHYGTPCSKTECYPGLSPSEAAATLGRVKTKKKARASQRNGRKGGRPKRVTKTTSDL